MNSSSKPAPDLQYLAPETFIDDAATLIIERHADRLPDLSSLTIAVAPRAASALRNALARHAGQRGYATLLLPRIGTLADLAQATPLAVSGRISPTAERVLDIFQILKKQRWLSSGETWVLSRELVQLADELTNNLVAVPATLEEHASNLARAYAIGKHNADFSFEARLTHDVWRTLAQPGDGQLDAPALYALQLAAWAAAATDPMYIIGSIGYSRREQAFFAAYAQRAPLCLLDQSGPGAPQPSTRSQFLAAAFAGAPMVVRASIAPNEAVVSKPEQQTVQALDTVQGYSAHDVEDEAGAALAKLRQWLIEGKRNIAVVALDRQAARRLRALAEREQILMSDEVGWPYSTTVSATAVMRWLEARRDGFYHATLIDLLKSPFIFADRDESWGRARIKTAVLAIEHAQRRAGVVSGLLRVREALQSIHPDAINAKIRGDGIALLDCVIEADRTFTSSRRPAAEWMKTLLESLATLGLQTGLAHDAAGKGLLEHFANAQRDVATSRVNLSMSEFTDWLRSQMESARFRDQSIDSPVVVTSLEATRYRQFEAVLLIGAAAGNLPGKPADSGIFNQSVRRSLGLSTFSDELQTITHDLFGLLARSPACWISWQGSGNGGSGGGSGDAQNPSPWVAALLLESKRRFGKSMLVANPEKTLARKPALARHSKALASRPAPILASRQVPLKISASGYQSLIDCPYQFFSRAVLRLREPDDVREEMEKRDFGEFVHDILNRFHQRFPQISTVDSDDAKAALLEETAAVFAAALAQNFTARAWRLQWESAIDAYLQWQGEREAGGWHWQAGELTSGFNLELEGGQVLRIEGRIDRMDQRIVESVAESAVIDYKARAHSLLKNKLKDPGEDVQLPVYVALAEAAHPERAVTEAAYLSIERNGVKPAVYPDAQHAGQTHVLRLQRVFEQMHAQTPLPAQGIDQVCEYCEARGLCRRDHWNHDADVMAGDVDG